MGKNKGMQAGAVGHTVKDLKAKFTELSQNVSKGQANFRTEWADKFNSLNERFKQIVMATGQQLAQINANQQIHSNVLEQLDVNTQAVARMGIEVFGRFEQIDHFLQKSDVKFDDLTQEELAHIKSEAKKSYEATMAECFRIVHEERKAAVEEQRKAAEKAKEEASQAAAEATKAETDAVESETAEQVLQEAENSRRLSIEAGGQGSEIPAGADVFGG